MMETKLSLERVIWLFEKHETLRIHNTARASTLITANSIVIAANTFLVGRLWNYFFYFKLDFWSLLADALICIGIILSFALAITSLFHALNSFIRHNRTSEDIFGKVPIRFFVHSRDTVNNLKSFNQFKNMLNSTTEKELHEYIVSDFYTVLRLHEYGYQKLRVSASYFIRSLYFLFLNILTTMTLTYIDL